MKINKINYEAYVVDYLEGTLSSADKQAMDDFLRRHPGIRAEIDQLHDWQLPVLPALNFPDKSNLLKNEEKPIRRIIMLRAIAASILALLGTASYLWYQASTNESHMDNSLPLVESVQPPTEIEVELPKNENEIAEPNTQDLASAHPETKAPADPEQASSPSEDESTVGNISKNQKLATKADLKIKENANLALEERIERKLKKETPNTDYVAQNQESTILPLSTPSTDEVVAALVEERRWQAFRTLPSAKWQATVKSSFPDLYIQLDEEVLLAQADRMIDRQKIVQLIQPESFTDDNDKGSIKDALIPEVFSSLFRKSSKTD